MDRTARSSCYLHWQRDYQCSSWRQLFQVGDTVTADVDLGFRIWIRGEKLRLYGIDAPEVRGATREAGIRSRDCLRSLILNKTVLLETIKDKQGKFGRYLTIIWLYGKKVNDLLVGAGCAVYRNYD